MAVYFFRFMVDVIDLQLDQPVIKQDAVFCIDIIYQPCICYGKLLRRPDNLFHGYSDLLPLGQFDLSIFHRMRTDFGSFRVEQYGYCVAKLVRCFPYIGDSCPMFFMITVGKVQAGDVHPCIHQLFQHFR